MNEQNQFRGKTPQGYEDGGRWLIGYLQESRLKWLGEPCHGSQPEEKQWFAKIAELKDNNSVIQCGNYYSVDPDTVGRCTGVRDKNGKMIYQGDIVHIDCKGDLVNHRVDWVAEVAAFRVVFGDDIYGDTMNGIEAECFYEVIGNVHDNPDLLTQERRDE